MTSTALFNLTDGLGYSASLPCNQSAASLSLQGLNCSTGTSSYDEALAFSPAKQTSDWITGCFVVVNVVVAVLAVLGNCTVVYVVFAYRRMRTVTNYFIANLALSDVLMALFCIPANTVTNLLLQYEDWPFYEWVCPLLMYAQTVAVFTSAFTLVTISLDRYLAIIYPMKPRTTSGQASVAMAIVWLAAILVSLPTAMHSEVISHPTGVSPKQRCVEVWQSMGKQQMYTAVVLVLQYVLPLLVLAFTYTRIAVVIWVKKVPGEADGSRDQIMAASKRKMVKMMIIVVVFYCLCWLPIHLINIVGETSRGAIYRWPHIQTVFMVCQSMAMSNSAVNPFVYCWMNARYRAGFSMAVLKTTPCCIPGDARKSRISARASGLIGVACVCLGYPGSRNAAYCMAGGRPSHNTTLTTASGVYSQTETTFSAVARSSNHLLPGSIGGLDDGKHHANILTEYSE